jgi:hypothetical protein
VGLVACGTTVPAPSFPEPSVVVNIQGATSGPNVGSHDHAGERGAVGGSNDHRRVGPHGIDDVVEHATSAWAEPRPYAVEQPDERIADVATQPSLVGHRVSEMVATIRPATTAAKPLRAASFEMMREKNEGDVGSDMG